MKHMIMKQFLDIILCIYAFFRPINAKKFITNENNKTDINGYSSSYYYDNEANDYDVNEKLGAQKHCTCCGNVLYYNYSTTYACNGREFCSAKCCKKFSGENLTKQDLQPRPVIDAVMNRRYMNEI